MDPERFTEAERSLTTADVSESEPLIEHDLTSWGHTFTADEVNAPDFGVVTDAVSTRLRALSAERERYAESLLRDKLPRRLHWLMDHPRLLKRVLRVVKRWEPTMTTVDLRQRRDGQHHTIQSFMSAKAAEEAGRAWLAAMNARGMVVSGPIFTYTDPSGLPAEIYGVR